MYVVVCEHVHVLAVTHGLENHNNAMTSRPRLHSKKTAVLYDIGISWQFARLEIRIEEGKAMWPLWKGTKANK